MFFLFILNSFPIRPFQSFHSLMGTLMEENSIYFIRYGRRGLSLVSINGFKSWGGEEVLLISPSSPTKVVCPSGFKPYVTLIIFVVFIESVFGSSAQLLNFWWFSFWRVYHHQRHSHILVVGNKKENHHRCKKRGILLIVSV